MLTKNKRPKAKSKFYGKTRNSLTTYYLLHATSVGFTLIELLIVIAILAGLAAIFMTTFPGAQKKARDAIRMSDIKQYQTAMEIYANKNDGKYFTASGSPSGSCSELDLPQCPDDPNGAGAYGISSSLTSYQIWAELEIEDTSTATPKTQYFVACSTGETGIKLDTPPSGSNCQI